MQLSAFSWCAVNLFIRRWTGHLMYRKPTYTDIIMWIQKPLVENALISHAITLSKANNFRIEMNKVCRSLQRNGFRKYDTASIIKLCLNPRPKPENSRGHKSVVFLPYINIHTWSRLFQRMVQNIGTKDKLNQVSSKGVYKIPCSCNVVYRVVQLKRSKADFS